MKHALIVIDMQQGSFPESAPKYDASGLVGRLNRMADPVRLSGGIVVFVQHDGPLGDLHHPDLPGWNLLPDIDLKPRDMIVRKRSCDAFLDTELELLLRSHAIDRLIIGGCATDYCVDTTVRSALAKRFFTIVPSDGHTTSDRPHLPAEKIIAHHNAIWADFIAPAGPAKVCLCANVLHAD